MFRIGQKVVFVDDGASLYGEPLDDSLTVGAIYTVSAVGLVHPFDLKSLPCIHVSERPDRAYGWWAHRFRPLVEKKTDISIFTSMLTPASKEKVGV